jgi:hypothetical protein
VAGITHQVAGIHITEESKGSSAPAKAAKKGTKGTKGKKPAGAAGAASAAAAAAQGAPASSLQEVFTKFAAGAEMDGKTFSKFAKDCKVLNKKCTTTDIDLIFARNKERTARKINYTQFAKAVGECATKRSETMEVLTDAILSMGGPVFAGTQAEAVRFHDDKDQYTGVHAHGGPSTVGGTGGVSDISQLCDRGAADVRGVQR